MVAALGPGATARPRRRRGLAAAAALAGVAAAGTAARALASALALGGPARPPAAARQAHACRVPACWRPIVAARRARGGDDEEVDVWKQAYQLEADRMDLISEQLKTEYERLGEVSQSLQQEYEGCILDLDSAPVAPEAEAAGDQWANAYTDLRRCNEQSELKVTEMRARLQGTIIEAAESTTPDVRGDWGPIRYKGITFKDIVFPRFFAEAGSKVYFIELEMPLGLKLEERTLAREGSRAVRAVEVAEVMPGASAAEDGRIRAGDIVRCITAPKRRVPSDEAGDEAGAFSEGEQTKAMLVIPTESSFPFEKVLEEIAENRNVDGYVGLVLERPLGDDEEQRQGEKGRVEAQPAGSTRGRPSPEPPAGLAARDGEVSLFGRPAPLRWAPGGRRAAAACAAAARGGLPPRPPAGRLAAGRAAGALRARAAGRRAVPGQAAQEAMDWVQRYIILPSAATSAPGPRARRPAGACTARSSWAPAPPRRRPAWAPRPSGSRPRALGSCTPPWSCALGCRTRDWEDFDVFDAYVQAWNRGRPFPAGTRGGTAVVPCEGLTDDQRQRIVAEAVSEARRDCTLVAFHPRFARWLRPAGGFRVGDTVRIDFLQRRVLQDPTFPGELAVVADPGLEDVEVGPREVCAQLVGGSGASSWGLDCLVPTPAALPIADNEMHRCPHVALHLLRRADLSGEGIIQEASAMRLRNSRKCSSAGGALASGKSSCLLVRPIIPLII
ncbi:unnamed protein product, partial [Prorocentrum cordatum]